MSCACSASPTADCVLTPPPCRLAPPPLHLPPAATWSLLAVAGWCLWAPRTPTWSSPVQRRQPHQPASWLQQRQAGHCLHHLCTLWTGWLAPTPLWLRMRCSEGGWVRFCGMAGRGLSAPARGSLKHRGVCRSFLPLFCVLLCYRCLLLLRLLCSSAWAGVRSGTLVAAVRLAGCVGVEGTPGEGERAPFIMLAQRVSWLAAQLTAAAPCCLPGLPLSLAPLAASQGRCSKRQRRQEARCERRRPPPRQAAGAATQQQVAVVAVARMMMAACLMHQWCLTDWVPTRRHDACPCLAWLGSPGCFMTLAPAGLSAPSPPPVCQAACK